MGSMDQQPQLFGAPLPVKIVVDDAAAAAVPLRDPVAIAVGTSSKELAPARADRKGGVLTNAGTAVVFVRFGAAASTSPGGYHLALQPNSAERLPPGAIASINVISTLLSSSTVTLTEW